MLALGEVQTTTLAHAAEASPAVAEQVLSLVRGERVRTLTRPISYAVSPDLFVGVDCRIPVGNATPVRVVGTVTGRVALTGGRVLQGSVGAWVVPGPTGNRRPWAHYLASPGIVETVARCTDPVGAADAHLAAARSSSTMGMGVYCNRLLAAVQQYQDLDGRPPFTTRRTTLRWVVHVDDGSTGERVEFAIEEDGLRTLRLTVPDPEHLTSAVVREELVALCEDVALHDWLLTSLLSLLERSRIGSDHPAAVVRRLRPAIEHLVHLWMPAARLSGPALGFWDKLERRPGMSRQWNTSVRRIRDQVALSGLLQ